MAKRYELTEEQFERIRDILPGKASDPGRMTNGRFGFAAREDARPTREHGSRAQDAGAKSGARSKGL